MTREQMIKVIYEKVADKTLSFGCKVITIAETKKSRETEYKKGKTIIGIYLPTNGGFDSIIANGGKTYNISPSEQYSLRSGNYNKLKRYISEIIGHTVMYGDIVDYFKINDILDFIDIKTDANGNTMFKQTKHSKIIELYKDKRKPIENQSDNCIEFIFNNLNLGQEKN